MTALQVRECPPDIYEQLRACAAEEGRSISQQVVVILREYLQMRSSAQASELSVKPRVTPLYANRRDETNYLEKYKKTLERIRKLPPIPISEKAPCSVEILAQIRREEAR